MAKQLTAHIAPAGESSTVVELWSVTMNCKTNFCIPRSNMPAFVVHTLLLNLKLLVNKDANSL